MAPRASAPTRRQLLGAGVLLGSAVVLGAPPPGPEGRVAHPRRDPLDVAAPTARPEDLSALADARLLHDVVAAEGLSPVMAARLLAYGSLTALLAADGPDPLGGVLSVLPRPLPRPPPAVRADLATAAAFSVLLPVLLGTHSGSGLTRVRAAVRLRLDPALGGDGRAAHVRYGTAIGTLVAQWAAADGCIGTARAPYVPADGAGSWRSQPGAPAPTDAWISRTARPFVVDPATLARPRPLPFDLAPGSRYRGQLEDLVDVTADLDDEQRAVAAFWEAPRGRSATPAGLWHLLAAEQAARRRDAAGASLWTVVALVDLAVYDALLRCWEVKYSTGCARPDQVVPRTAPGRRRWRPLLTTPPFPEYTSGHSAISGAAAGVLTSLLGRPADGVRVTAVETTPTGPRVRRFLDWVQAAQEASTSRQLGGIHFRQACEDGLREGALVAEQVLVRAGGDRP